MKTHLFSAFLFLTLVAPVVGQQPGTADAIIGIWTTGNGKARVEIKKYNQTYYGQIVWLKEPNDAGGNPKTDKNNPDKAKQKQPILGLRLLLGFVYKGDNEWKDGTIYDPESGSTYSCNMELTDANTLKIRGYVGISLLGRTDTWKRFK